jgi:hypothetical protein
LVIGRAVAARQIDHPDVAVARAGIVAHHDRARAVGRQVRLHVRPGLTGRRHRLALPVVDRQLAQLRPRDREDEPLAVAADVRRTRSKARCDVGGRPEQHPRLSELGWRGALHGHGHHGAVVGEVEQLLAVAVPEHHTATALIRDLRRHRRRRRAGAAAGSNGTA